jgi:hypothetical protein
MPKVTYDGLISPINCGDAASALLNVLSKRLKHKKQTINVSEIKSTLGERKLVTITLEPVHFYYLQDHILTCLYDPTDSRYHVLDSYIQRKALTIRSMDSDQFDHFLTLISSPMTHDHWCEFAGLPLDSVFDCGGPDTEYKITVMSYPFRIDKFDYVKSFVPLSHL